MAEHVQITGIPPRIQYVANGTQTTFEYPFAIFKPDNMRVYFNDVLRESTTYTVSGVGETAGGTVTFVSAPAQNTVVTLVRVLDIERTTDFQEGGALRADALNYEFDYQIACQQQLADNLNRSMVLPPYATNMDADLTLPLPLAGKAIVWNATGTNLENSRVSINEIADTMTAQVSVVTAKAAEATSAADSAAAQAIAATTQASTAAAQADIATQKATEAATVLSNCATVSMDNVTQAGKTTVIDWGMPDKNARIDIKSALTTSPYSWTAPCEGIVKLYAGGGNKVWGISSTSASSDDDDLCYINTESGIYVTAYLPVSKNETIYSTERTGNTAEFWPLKGAQNA